MLKARLQSRLRESREEGFAELWHQACLKRQTAKAHASNSEFLGQQRFEQLHSHVRGFNQEFLGRFPDATLGKLLEIATFHSCQEQNVIAVQAQRSTSMFVIISGSVALFHKKADNSQGNGESGGAPKLTSAEVESPGSTEKADKREDDLSSDNDEPRVDTKTNKSGYLHLLDWRTYPDSQASRFRKYFCVLSKGSLQWFESKDSVRVVGSEDVASAEHCMLLAPGTVGYKKTAQHVRESEIASLSHCFELNFVAHGSTYPRRTVFLAKSFDASLAWVRALQSWMDIPSEEVLTSSLPRVFPRAENAKLPHHQRGRMMGSPLQQGGRRKSVTMGRAGAEEEQEGAREGDGGGGSGTEDANETGHNFRRQRRGGVTMALASNGANKMVQDVVKEPEQKQIRVPPRRASGLGLRKQGSLRSIGAGTRELLNTSFGSPLGGLERQPSSGGAATPELGARGLLPQMERAGSSMLTPPRRRRGSVTFDAEDRRGSGVGGAGDGDSLRRVGSGDSEQTSPQWRGRRGSTVMASGLGMVGMASMAGMESMSPAAFETHAAAGTRKFSNELSDRAAVGKGLQIATWYKARNVSPGQAWGVAKDVFGEPICVLEAGDSFGEGAMLVDRRRTSSAVAVTQVRVLELSKAALMGAGLYDVLLHGMVWASPIVNTFLRPHPLLRQENQISVILNIVAESSFFQQLPIEARRGLLEGGHLRVTAHGEQVLGAYTPPFSLRNPPPLYIILTGRVEVHQGPRVLSEAIAGLQSCSVQEMQQFFPRKGQVLLAEEAWGGPLVWTDLRSLQVHKLQEQIPLEKEANKAHRLRQQLWSLQEAFTYTLVATEATTYLRVDPHDWLPVLSGVRDVVFRATTLHQILKKPPRERAPQQARLIASLLQGFTAFQQLPLSIVLNLAYEMEFFEARAGKLLVRQGEPLEGVHLVLQGTVGVFKDDGDDEYPSGDFPLGSMLSREEVGLFFGDQKREMAQGAWFGEEGVRSGEVARESVITAEDCKILVIPAKAFRKETKHTGLERSSGMDDRARGILAKEPKQRNKEEQDLLADALGSVGWLAELEKQVRRRIADVVQLKRAEHGQALARQGSTSDALTFFVSGSVSVHHLGVGIEEPGHMAEGFDLTTAMSEEHSWVYAPLTAKWGKCITVMAAGGSIGELGFAMGSERGSSVLTREVTEYFCLEKDALGYELMYLLKAHLRTRHGIPASIKKVPGTRTEYDMVQLIGFLTEHPFFKSCTEKILGQVAQLVELFRFEPGQVVQVDKEGEKLLHIVDGGRVRLQRVTDAGRALAAKFKVKMKQARMAKLQVSRRMLVQELSVMTAKAARRQSIVQGELSRSRTQKPLPMPSNNNSEEESQEPAKAKPKEMRQLGAMEKSHSKKALIKVFSSGFADKSSSRLGSVDSVDSEQGSTHPLSPRLGSPMVRARAGAAPGGSASHSPAPSSLLGVSAARRLSDASPIKSVASAPSRRASSDASSAPGTAGLLSRTSSPQGNASLISRTSSGASTTGRISRTASANSKGVLLDWGKHFVLGEAVAETRVQILRMPYTRWLHLQKVSGTLEKLDAANFFSRLKCFAAWNKKELSHLADKARVHHFARDARVVKRGEELVSLLFLKRGRCMLTQHALPSYQGLGGSEMAEDDRLYRVQKRKVGDGKDYQQRITAGKLFRCPACQEQAKKKGKGKQQHPKIADEAEAGVCKVCHGTRAIRPGAMARAPAGKTGTESVVGKAVGAVLPKGLINCALERIDAPLEHEVVAAEDCEVYSVDLDHLMDMCDAKPKLLRALTEESQRVAKWHAAKHKEDIVTRSAIRQDVEQLKNPTVTGPLGGEQPNTDMYKRLYPQEPALNMVVPRNMGSLSKSGRKGALLIGTWKNKTQMPNHRVDSQTQLLMHAAHGPQADSQLSGDQSSLLETEAELKSGSSSLQHLRRSVDSEEEEQLASGDSDGLEDFFVTTGSGMAAEQNRMAWDGEDGAVSPSRNTMITVDETARQKAQSVIPTLERSQDSSVALSRASVPRSKSALDVFCEEEAAKLLQMHLEVMVGGGMPTLGDRWKRNARKRRASLTLRAVSSSPNAVEHITTLQRLREQDDLGRGGINLSSPPRRRSPPRLMPPVHSGTKHPHSSRRDPRALLVVAPGNSPLARAQPGSDGARSAGKGEGAAAAAAARQLDDSLGEVWLEGPSGQDEDLDGWGSVYSEEEVRVTVDQVPARVLPVHVPGPSPSHGGRQLQLGGCARRAPGSRRSKLEGSVRSRDATLAEAVPVRSFNLDLAMAAS